MARQPKTNIAIVGEGLTERYYFLHLKALKGYRCTVKPRQFSNGGDIIYIERKAKEFLSVGMKVICVFDTDIAERNEAERQKIVKFKDKYGKNEDVIICDSLPSIEFWFLLHFKKTNRKFSSYSQIKKELVKFLPDYDKTEKYLRQDKWVRALLSTQEDAIENAKTIANGGSYSNIYKAIELLEKD